MPDLLTKLPGQFKEFWNNLDKSNRNKLIIMSVVIFVCVIITLVILTRPTYTMLINSMDSNETKEVLSSLEKSNIEYKIGEGNSVKVKKNDLNKAKAVLLQDGLPKNGVALADYDMSKLGTTDKQRERMYKEYKEKDLAATLKEYDNIRSAVVKLSMPEKSNFFGEDDNEVKASVAINSYSPLNDSQVIGIERFIAGSVEGLETENVTILDNNANILNDGYENNDIAQSLDKQYVYKETIKQGIEKQLKELLSGQADNVRIMANIEFDFDSLVTNSEIYEPVVDEQGIVRSKGIKKETVTNGVSGGVPGTDSNPPTYPNSNDSRNSGEYKLTDETYNYEINKKVSQYSKEIGKIDREISSIAVALYYVKQDETNANVANAAIPKADANQIMTIVASATGIPKDNIAVNIFDISAAVQEQEGFNPFEIAETFGPMLIMTVLVILIAFAILRRRNESTVVADEENEEGMYQVSKNVEDAVSELDFEEKSQTKKQIDSFVRKKPEAVAQLLRNWLSEDWE